VEGARPPSLRACTWQTCLDKPLSGAVDRGETDAQNGSAFFISRSCGSVEQQVGSGHFAR